MADTAEIGVFGGSGFYSLLDDVREVKVDTPYGAAVGLALPRRRRRAAGRVPAASRPSPHDPAAPDQLPGQRLGDALARRQGGHLAVRRRLARARRRSPATSSSATSSSTGPGAAPTPSTTARSSPTSRRPTRTTRAAPARHRDDPRPRHRPSTSGGPSSSSRDRASRPRRSRSGSPTPAGRSST